jgi:hypothetical protein
VDAQRPLEGFHVARSGPVAIWCKDGHLAHLPHRLCESKDSRGLNAVVIGNKNMHDYDFQLPILDLRLPDDYNPPV